MRIREKTKRNASGYSSGSDISDLDLSSPASINSIVSSFNRLQKGSKVSEKRPKVSEVSTSASSEKLSEANASGSSETIIETQVSEMARITAKNGSAAAETGSSALITYFKCAATNKFVQWQGQHNNEPIMDVEMQSAEADKTDPGA